jgi:repressor LexA
MPEPMTDLERSILDYLVEYLRTNTYQPSIREIGQRFDIKSTKTVSELLQSLANKGWIERDPSRSRGVRLLGLGMQPETVSVPCYGSDAGQQSPAAETFELDRKIAGASGAFLHVMLDDSMQGDAIRAGDMLLVEPIEADALESGDLVLLRAGGERLVRRLNRRGTDMVLEASAAGHPAVVPLGPEGLRLEGRITSVVRRIRPARVEGTVVDTKPLRSETP